MAAPVLDKGTAIVAGMLLVVAASWCFRQAWPARGLKEPLWARAFSVFA